MSARIIKRFGKSYTVTRKAAGAYVAGKWVQDGEDEELTIIAVQSPLKTKELQLLPEGTRLDTIWKLSTQTVLQTNDNGKSADIVTINGLKYQVLMPLDWMTHDSKAISIKFYEVIVQLLEVQP